MTDTDAKPLSQQETTDLSREQAIRSVLQHLRVVFRSMQAHSRWVEKQCGVSGAQLWAMWELFAEPGLRVSDLSRILAIHQSTASNMLDKLEAKSLIRRDRSGPDQRVVRLFLTAEGTQLLGEAPRPAQGAIIHALQQLGDENLEHLNNSLLQLISSMDFNRETDAGLRPVE